ncbi:MAG: hypothetical protein V3R25_05955 [Nitrosomonadaceae bacterium]
MTVKTTRAMREYLERRGIIPSGDAKKDMKLAKSIKPDYQEYLKGKDNGTK